MHVTIITLLSNGGKSLKMEGYLRYLMQVCTGVRCKLTKPECWSDCAARFSSGLMEGLAERVCKLDGTCLEHKNTNIEQSLEPYI